MSPVLTASPNGVDIAYRYFAGTDPHRSARPGASADAVSTDAVSTDTVPVLLVHGMGGDGRTWDAFVRALRSCGRTVITVDLRGHGRSGRAPSYLFEEFAQDIIGLCEHLELDRVDIVGHSLGGRAASLVAQELPQLVRRLVLEEMPVPLRADDPAPEVPPHRPTVHEMWHAVTSFVRSPRGLVSFDKSLADPALDQFRSPAPSWWEALPRIESPVMFVRGTRPGSMVDPRLLAAMARALPTMTVREAPCGHSVHRDRRAYFQAAVLPFLEG